IGGFVGHVGKRGSRAGKRRSAPPESRGRVGVEPGGGSRVSEAVVGAALLGILQDVVGLLDFLKPLLRRLVAGVHVGMEFSGEPPVRLLDIGVGRAFRDAQNLVVIALFHRFGAIIVRPKIKTWTLDESLILLVATLLLSNSIRRGRIG